MSDHIEEWRDVVGYEGLYKVSNKGRVKSERQKTRIADKDDRIMKQKLDDKGYCRVNLHNENGRCKSELVSRLVADAFVPNPNNLPHVGHDDDVKTHNDSTNLYWTNPDENNHHNGKMERFQDAHREKIDIIADKLSTGVKGTALNGSEEIIFKSMQEAKRNGFDCGKVSMCVNGKRNSHKGYRWERINND